MPGSLVVGNSTQIKRLSVVEDKSVDMRNDHAALLASGRAERNYHVDNCKFIAHRDFQRRITYRIVI